MQEENRNLSLPFSIKTKGKRLVGVSLILWLSLCAMLGSFSPASAVTLAKGVEIRQLTNDGKSSLSLNSASPNGKLVAYIRQVTDDTVELCVFDLEKGTKKPVSDTGQYISFAWSRDGGKLAFFFAKTYEETSEISLSIWDSETGKTTRTAMRSKFTNSMSKLTWAPGGAAIALERNREDMLSGVFIVPTDGSAATEVAPNHYHNCFGEYRYSMVWSPDGSKLAFITRDENEKGTVWVVDSDGKNLKAVVKSISCLWGLAWSWDGKRIAFNSGEGRREEERTSGMADIWIVNADGSNPHPITQGTAVAYEDRTYWMILDWTKDNKYVMGWFGQPDPDFEWQESYHGFAFVEADTGKIIEAYRNENGTSNYFHCFSSWDFADDGKRVAYWGRTYTVRGPRGGQQTSEDEHTHLRVFSTETKQMENFLTYRTEQDNFRLSSAPAWVFGDQAIVITRRRIVSETENVYENDLILVSLPKKEEPLPTADNGKAVTPTATTASTADKSIPGLVDVPILHRRAEEVADLLPDVYKGMFTVDESRNCLVVPCNDSNLESLKQCVAAIDNHTPHIMVNVLVAELTKEASKELGLDWTFANGRFGGVLPFSDGGTPGSVFWDGVTKLDDEFFLRLSALEEEGKAEVRSNPRVLAISGKEASITIRRTDFFVFTTVSSYGVSSQRSDISADTILKITPTLLGNGRINISVDATVDSFTFAGKDDLPDTTRRQAVTEVACGDQESIVIGGLTQHDETTTVRKTPLLGDLPVLGSLFRHTNKQMRESTLVIFITPHVVKE